VNASGSCSIGGWSALLLLLAVCKLLCTKVGEAYCRLLHRSISRPMNGKYRCLKCLREFQLEW
jgi:hypothetical protein